MTKLSTRASIALLAVVLVVALVAGWFLVVGPKRSEASRLQAQIDDTKAQIAVLQVTGRRHAGPPPIRVADLFRLSRAMPDQADIPGVLLQLSSVAAETGVSFQSIAPQAPVQDAGYQQISINLVFQGRFYNLSDFLYRLRNLVQVHNGVLSAAGRLFSVDSVSFAQGDLQFPQVKATLTVSAYVFGDGLPTPIPTGSAGGTAPSVPATAAPAGATAAGALGR